jgi:hypothetical protein
MQIKIKLYQGKYSGEIYTESQLWDQGYSYAEITTLFKRIK